MEPPTRRREKGYFPGIKCKNQLRMRQGWGNVAHKAMLRGTERAKRCRAGFAQPMRGRAVGEVGRTARSEAVLHECIVGSAVYGIAGGPLSATGRGLLVLAIQQDFLIKFEVLIKLNSGSA